MSSFASIFGDGFDPSAHEPSKDYEVLPPGKYNCEVTKVSVKRTKKQNGHYLEVELTVLDGPSKNRKLWDRINIDNPSVKCVEIGLSHLSALCEACGLPGKVNNEDLLLNHTVVASVKVKNDSNEIQTYKSVGEINAQQAQAQALAGDATPYCESPVVQQQPTEWRPPSNDPPWLRPAA